MTRHVLSCSSLIAVALMSAGCLSQPALKPALYRPEAKRPDAPALSAMAGSVKVHALRVAPGFDGRSFVIRTDAVRYVQDPYNAFLVPPDAWITMDVCAWLGKSGLFRHVLDSASRVPPEFTLDGVVTALYADRSGSGAARSVLSIEFTLTENAAKSARVRLQKTYTQEAPAANPFAPPTLALAWGQALTAVLASLETDLRAALALR